MRITARFALRMLIGTSFVLLGLLFATGIAVFLFFDPNEFKPQITTFLTEKTGLPIAIEGKLALSLFPHVAIEAEHVRSSDLAYIEKLSLSIPLRDLLAKKFFLHDLRLHNADITYTDPRKQNTWKITALALEATQQADQHWVLRGHGRFALPSGTVPWHADTTFEGTLRSIVEPVVELRTQATVSMPHAPWDQSSVQATIVGDLKKQIRVEALDVRSPSFHATGTLTLPLTGNKTSTFSIAMESLDLDQLSTLQKNSSSVNATRTTSTTAAVSTVSTSPTSSSFPRVSGQLTIGTLRWAPLVFENVKTAVSQTDNTLSLTGFTASFYGGALHATLAKTGDHFAGQGTLQSVMVASLLHTLKKPNLLSGKGHVNFKFSGKTSNLHGVIACRVEQGTLYGVDLSYYLAWAQSFLKKQANPLSDTRQTDFNTLLATLNLHDNIIDNNDLTLTGNGFHATAQGSVYLNNQTLAYKLHATQVDENGQPRAHTYPLAIRIKGPIQKPKIEPDLDVYLKKLAEKALHQQVDQKIRKGLGKILENLTAPKNE